MKNNEKKITELIYVNFMLIDVKIIKKIKKKF
jgi:hypothetical protein